MAYVICDPCIGVKDGACQEVCPVDCIGSSDDEPQMYIDPNECITCGLCETVCPVNAIYDERDMPEKWRHSIEVNAKFFGL